MNPEDTPRVPYSEAKKYVKQTLKAVEAGVYQDKAEAREMMKKPWEDGTLSRFTAEKEKTVEQMFEDGSLYMTKPWLEVPAGLVNDPAIAKIETGGEGQGLVFEHRNHAKKRGVLIGNSSEQVLHGFKESYENVFESAKDPKFIEKVKALNGFALGDDDFGAAFTLWLLQRIKEGDDIRKYEKFVQLVGIHDRRGRIHLYPEGESSTSLVMTNWGIMLSSKNDTEKVAQYLTTFDYLARHPEHLHDGIPAPTPQSKKSLDQWIKDSHEQLEKAEVRENYVLCRNCEVLNGTTKWDEIGAEGYRKYDGKKAVITVSSPDKDGKKEMQISTYGYYYIPPFAGFLKSKGLSPWYGDGFLGMYSQEGYDENNLVADYEEYLTTHREEIENAVEFEIIFDDKEFMENVLDFALTSGIITGYATTPEYYQREASYKWDDYGQGSAMEKQTKINRDANQVVRFLAKRDDKEKIMQYLNNMFGKGQSDISTGRPYTELKDEEGKLVKGEEKTDYDKLYPDGYTGKRNDGWIVPLIQVTDKGVNKKAATYLKTSTN